MQQSSQKQGQTDHTTTDKGLAYYPISDLHFDVVALVYEKSKALQAYDRYSRDALEHKELHAIIEEIRSDDKKHVEKLKKYLGEC